MAGHDLLPGCQVPWRHPDCPGYQPAEEPGTFGGLVCHCPCHRLLGELGRDSQDERTAPPESFAYDMPDVKHTHSWRLDHQEGARCEWSCADPDCMSYRTTFDGVSDAE